MAACCCQGKLARVLATPENSRCADCGAPHPQWASLSFGCIFCIRCSGVHRSLGTSISRVRSLQLDEWSETQLRGLEIRGNKFVNSILESEIPSDMHKPNPHSTFEELSTWIKAKYVEQRFRHKPTNEEEWKQREAEDIILNNGYTNDTSNLPLLESMPTISESAEPTRDPAKKRPGRIKSCTISAFHSPGQLRMSYSESDSRSEKDDSNKGETIAARPDTPKRRNSAKLTKKDIERGWASFHSEWKDSEDLERQQQLERKRMIEEAKQRKKEKTHMRRSTASSSFTSFSSSSSSTSSSSSSSSNSSHSVKPSTRSFVKSERGDGESEQEINQESDRAKDSRVRRLSRDLTSFSSFSSVSCSSLPPKYTWSNRHSSNDNVGGRKSGSEIRHKGGNRQSEHKGGSEIIANARASISRKWKSLGVVREERRQQEREVIEPKPTKSHIADTIKRTVSVEKEIKKSKERNEKEKEHNETKKDKKEHNYHTSKKRNGKTKENTIKPLEEKKVDSSESDDSEKKETRIRRMKKVQSAQEINSEKVKLKRSKERRSTKSKTSSEDKKEKISKAELPSAQDRHKRSKERQV